MATKPAEGGESFTNYVAYKDPRTTRSRIGHYDSISQTIQPLSFISGTPIDNLYQVIEVGEVNIISSGEPIAVSSVKILPPLADRDVLCVGKNYAEHAKEFNSSGFDSSDKVDQPSHYEGEIGVIIGKPGFRISEEDAMSHVWGYTIINDMTARERQRDHKQFYIGKSADTFCPMVRLWKSDTTSC
jgi:2-keto-4-pentenoate hydratase/2-oxohepta-3-ene-1,7-dioic acid hydratase in catechol pathway